MFGTVVASDLDSGDTLQYAVDTQPAKGSLQLNVNTGVFTYTPNDDENGSDPFIISVNDGTDTVVGNYDVTINPINDSPTISAQSLSDEDQTLTTTVVANDVVGDSDLYSRF